MGDEKIWTSTDVKRIVSRVRNEQKRLPNSSVRAMEGTFATEIGGKALDEDSVEVIIMNEYGDEPEKFIADMKAIGERLRIELRQEIVILKVEDDHVTILSTRCHA